MPNKCLALGHPGTQHDSMITKKCICIVAGTALLAACAQKTETFSTAKPTPTATPGRKGITPGRPTEKPTPAPSPY